MIKLGSKRVRVYPLVDEKCRHGRFHSRLFFATPFPAAVLAAAVDAFPFFSFSSRVLSIRETFPLDAVLAGGSDFDEEPPSTFLGDLDSPAASAKRSCFFGVLNTRGSIPASPGPGEGDRLRAAFRADRRVGVVGNSNFGGRPKSGEKSGCSGGSLLCSEGLWPNNGFRSSCRWPRLNGKIS